MRRRAFLLLLPGVAGCVGMTFRPNALDEAVRVEEFRLSFTDKGEGELSLFLDVSNPTFWDATVTGVDFELALDGRRYAVGTRGLLSPVMTSNESRVFVVHFPLRCEPTADAGRSRAWRVEVKGSVGLSFGERVRRMPFHAGRDLRLVHFRPLRVAPD
jgi:hypothetical protein